MLATTLSDESTVSSSLSFDGLTSISVLQGHVAVDRARDRLRAVRCVHSANALPKRQRGGSGARHSIIGHITKLRIKAMQCKRVAPVCIDRYR